MKTRAQTIFSVILIASILVPMAGAVYVLNNGGTFTINHGALYVDGVTVDQYIIGLVGVGGGNFDQSLNTTDDVTFNSLTLDGEQRTMWPQTGVYTYIVVKVGANTYAYNRTGDLVYGGSTDEGGIDGADAQEVLHACAHSRRFIGGTVYATAAFYSIDDVIVWYSGVNLYGDGGDQAVSTGTIFYAANGLNDNVFEFDTGKTGDGSNSTDFNRDIQFRDFCIDGNDAGNTGTCNGIYAWCAVNCLFERLNIRDVEDDAIYLDGYTGSGQLDSYDNDIVNCYIEAGGYGIHTRASEENGILDVRTGGCGTAGIYLASNINTVIGGVDVYSTVAIKVDGNREKIIGHTSDRPKHEAYLLSSGTQIKLIDCHMHAPSDGANNTYAAIRSVSATYVLLEGCSLSSYTSGDHYIKCTYVVHLDAASCDYWTIKDNDFKDYWVTAWKLYDDGSGAHNKEVDNWT